ncbi:6,7-dimethyl-8-ribityllumazine synthase [Agrococcus beijingensis]|uniref:6,7-dimethyl-8-ribityllumazine synthase n=1 Tax=Agrococcus beijingensis TaxID=3068634 RepID=UPI002741FAB6|nr:6,7-dimethyl-8-ribityllumazine synthase [Agrococcus sp. REN33]
MAGEGRPTASTLDASGLRIAIVHGRWHEQIATGLLEGSRRALAEMGAEVVELPVPGAFELAVVAQGALEAGFDGAVALGVIIRGGTPHFEYISASATQGLTDVALRTGKPIGFGVLTLDDEQQGIDRAGLPGSKEDKGREAAEAVVEAALALRFLHG